MIIRHIDVVPRYRDAISRHAKNRPNDLIASLALRIGGIADINYLQPIIVRDVGIVPRHRHALRKSAGDIAAHSLWVGRVTHVDHVQTPIPIYHIRVLAQDRHA